MELDPTSRDNFFPGLTVRISKNGENIYGVVKEVLTQLAHDPNGIYLKLESGEMGNCIEIVQTKTEIESNLLVIQMNKDLKADEGQYIEFKETFGAPTNPMARATKFDSKVMFSVGKTVQAFANTGGGTLYIGIKDRVKTLEGLDRDVAIMEEGKKDIDALEIEMKSRLRKFFSRENKIFEIVDIRIIQYQGKDVCIVKVGPSDFPFCLTSKHTGSEKDYFYVRIGNSSEMYTANQFFDYWLKRKINQLELNF
jgi:predicted HTH transcriptional regulator/uncharacterized protein YwbE